MIPPDPSDVATVRVYRDGANAWRWTARDADRRLIADSRDPHPTYALARFEATDLFPDAELSIGDAFLDTPGDPAAIDLPPSGRVSGFALSPSGTGLAESDEPPPGADAADEPGETG